MHHIIVFSGNESNLFIILHIIYKKEIIDYMIKLGKQVT